MSIIKNHQQRKSEINLLSTEVNGYILLGTAQEWGKQLDLDVDSIIKDMESSDYEHLIKVFDKHFGSIVDLVYRG